LRLDPTGRDLITYQAFSRAGFRCRFCGVLPQALDIIPQPLPVAAFGFG
jgi:hypothetical protein